MKRYDCYAVGMCGRFYLDVGREQLSEHYEHYKVPEVPEVPEDLIPRYNIAPSEDILAVCAVPDHEHVLTRLHWDLIPSWAKEENTHYAMINARAETVADKPAYRSAFIRRSCLIPVSGFL